MELGERGLYIRCNFILILQHMGEARAGKAFSKKKSSSGLQIQTQTRILLVKNSKFTSGMALLLYFPRCLWTHCGRRACDEQQDINPTPRFRLAWVGVLFGSCDFALRASRADGLMSICDNYSRQTPSKREFRSGGGAVITPGKDPHTRRKPLALASGNGRYITVTPERTLLSVGK
jgi:hypothetical protein